MAGAHYAITSFLTPSAKFITIRRNSIALSSLSVPFPSKLIRRKNYLRPKLLETLTKPYPITPLPPHEPPKDPIIPVEIPHRVDIELPSVQVPSEPCVADAGEDEQKVDLSEISGTVGTPGVPAVSVGTLSTRSVLKLGMYLVGIFVVQTICAVLVFGSADSDQKHGNSEIETEPSINGMNEKKLLLNGNGISFGEKSESKPGYFVYVNESELEAKIAEIRMMAREARESEGKNAKTVGVESDIDDGEDDEVVNGNPTPRGIEKEVYERLFKLQKRLNSVQKKSPGSLSKSGLNSVQQKSPVSLSKSGKVEDKVNKEKDSLSAKEMDSNLIFKKNHKFRSQLTKPRNDDVKGFQGLEDNGNVSKKKKSNSAPLDSMVRSGSTRNSELNSFDSVQHIDLSNDNLKEINSGSLQKDDTRELISKESNSSQDADEKMEKTEVRKDTDVDKTKANTGVVQETSNERPSIEVTKSTKSSELKTLSSQGKKVGSKTVANKAKSKQSDYKKDLWWLNLPYVLAILLRRGYDGAGGLYTLMSTSSSNTQDQSASSSYTVAFEDRSEANNFCNLLEICFEDLGDFSADIVPLSNKDLREGVESNSMKLIVVKKGQLKLYAGQPLADVEMALRALIEQN